MSTTIVGKTSTEITLSVAVTAHSEGRLLRPTIRSIAAAISLITSQSISCELLIILDKATDETVAEAEHWAEPGRVDVPVRVVRHSVGDAGASRNAATQNALGTYLAFCDGDDLVTSNYFAEALHILTGTAGPVIVHPSQVVSFGARSTIWNIPASESVDHLHLIRHNLWPSSSVSQRSTYLDFPYAQLPAGEGFGPEDWLWNIETSIAGIPHQPAIGTMFFYRVREFGGVNNGHLHSILPPFDLDGLIEALPLLEQAPSGPASHSLRRRILRRCYRIARPVAKLVTMPLGKVRRQRIYNRVMRVARPLNALRTVSPAIEAALREAAELEPALSWTAHGYSNLEEWSPRNDGYAALLVDLVKQLHGRADALVTVPWVGIGGADLVSLNYAKALFEDGRFNRRVSMLATYLPSRTLRHLVPKGVTFVQVPEAFRELTPELQRRLLAQVIIMVEPKLVVSVNCFDVTNALQLYGRQLGSLSRIYLTLFAFDRIGARYPVNPITDDSQRAFLDEIEGILTDNTVTAGIVKEMLALDGKVSVHHQPALEPIPPLATNTRAYSDHAFSENEPFRLVWPHRLDKEKRPDVLIAIARRLRENAIPVEISVHGQQVLSSDGVTLMKSLTAAGIKYCGPYQGGLMSLPTDEYHALLLTSESEGLPLVLVQSMLLGLPVISSAVGGVTDIVVENETGLLAAHDDIDGFVTAIRQLMDSLDARRRIIHRAYDFAVAQHSWATFTKLVDGLA